MKIADTDILFLAGLGNSGPGHWQRRWAEKLSTAQWVEHEDWNAPGLDTWTRDISRAVMMSTRPVVLVAHSLGVLAAVHAARQFADTKVRGAFLVAPPDPAHANAPAEVTPFAAVPRDPLPFPSMVVASITDPYCSIEQAADFAAAWGSDYHVSGADGHLNAESGHGPWPEGLLMFTRLMQRLK